MTSIYPTAAYPSYPYGSATYTTTTSTTTLDHHQVAAALQDAHRMIGQAHDRIAVLEADKRELWGCLTFLTDNPGKTVEDWRKYCQVSDKINSTLDQEKNAAYTPF